MSSSWKEGIVVGLVIGSSLSHGSVWIFLLDECSTLIIFTGWWYTCDWGSWCSSSLGYRELGWTSVIWVSLPSVWNFSDSGFSSIGFDQMWSSGKKSIVGGFVVGSSFSHGSVWIGFDLGISTWIWLLIWVVDVLVVIRLFLISEIEWLLELLDTIVLLIDFLWNEAGWSIRVDCC